MTLEEAEGILIGKALARTGGNVSRAARSLGMSRTALYRRHGKTRAMNRLGFQARIVLISLAAGLPACAALLILLWTGDHEPRVRYGFSLLAVGALSGGLILLPPEADVSVSDPRQRGLGAS